MSREENEGSGLQWVLYDEGVSPTIGVSGVICSTCRDEISPIRGSNPSDCPSVRSLFVVLRCVMLIFWLIDESSYRGKRHPRVAHPQISRLSASPRALLAFFVLPPAFSLSPLTSRLWACSAAFALDPNRINPHLSPFRSPRTPSPPCRHTLPHSFEPASETFLLSLSLFYIHHSIFFTCLGSPFIAVRLLHPTNTNNNRTTTHGFSANYTHHSLFYRLFFTRLSFRGHTTQRTLNTYTHGSTLAHLFIW